MSKTPTRKQFLGRLLGLAAGIGLMGPVAAKAATPSAPAAGGPATRGVTLRPEQRAVPRRVS